jgi:hypothetical protein
MNTRSANIAGLMPRAVRGIAERDRPISIGTCGNDDCQHTTHKDRRKALKAADTRAKR